MGPTQGPYALYDDGPDGSDVILAHVDGENYDIAYISNDDSEGRPPEERKANARLLVASWKMFALFKDMIAEIEDNTDTKGVELDPYFESRVRDLIAEITH